MKPAARARTTNALAGALATACLLAAGGAAAQAYKWTDAQGKVHFSDTPPPDRKAATVSIKPQMPADPAAVARQRDWKAQLEESGTRRLEAQNQQAAEERNRKNAESRCLAARRNVDTYQREGLVYRTGKDGQREYLEDKERATLLARAQERVESDCR